MKELIKDLTLSIIGVIIIFMVMFSPLLLEDFYMGDKEIKKVIE